MSTVLINEELNRLPEGDSHPYRTGPWQPNMCEYDDLAPEVRGSIPEDLNGTYIRNTENPLRKALGRYHPLMEMGCCTRSLLIGAVANIATVS